MLVIVYLAVNRVNGKKYVGITRKPLAERCRRHFGDAARGSKLILHGAIRKYGEGAFEFSVLKTCLSYDEAKLQEVAMIAELRPEYNATKGGDGALGYRHSPETIEKMRLAKLGKPGPWRGKKRPDMAEGARQRQLANPLRYWAGKKRDPAVIAKMIEGRRGKPMTDKQLAVRKINIKKATASLCRKIRCVDDGNVFSSLTEAAEYYGSLKANICSVLKGRLKTSAGRRFEYLEL